MSRIPLFPEAGFDPLQKEIYEKIASGPRGAVVGPLRAALHSPELADRWQAFGEFLRFSTSLPPRLSELAILVSGRHWNSAVEWYIHCAVGLRAGLSESVLEAMRAAQPPTFDQADEAAVYEYARNLLAGGQIPEPAYQAVYSLLGEAGIVELTALIGYYTMVAMTLNAHNVLPPEGESKPIQFLAPTEASKAGAVTILPAGRLMESVAQREA